LTTLYQFATNPAYGNNPYGGLIKVSGGGFCGTTETYGTAFSFATNGTPITFSSFFGLDGYSLNGPLTQGTDGNLYGAAGLKAFNQQGGIIFKCAAYGVTTILTQFSGTNGDQP
jgi:hypothetical protein